jgi:hypothetical protein
VSVVACIPGLREAVSCTIAAHHAYLSSSVLGVDSLRHTSSLYGECGMFGLATCVPSLRSTLQILLRVVNEFVGGVGGMHELD